MSIKSIVKEAFRRGGLDIRGIKHTEQGILSALLVRSRPGLVVDVGANSGQFVRRLRSCGYRGRVISFEPLAQAHAQLTANALGDPNWLVAPRMALGRVRSHQVINVAANSVSSSFLPMRSVHTEVAPHAAYCGREDVQVERLDSVLLQVCPGEEELLLKIDTQGYEVEVLHGATGILPRVAALQLELSLTPVYEGAPSLIAVASLVEELGFELFHLLPGLVDDRHGRLLQADGFYIRRERGT
jgi:FkbM family methyltransferase